MRTNLAAFFKLLMAVHLEILTWTHTTLFLLDQFTSITMAQGSVEKISEEIFDTEKEKLVPKLEFLSISETLKTPFTDNFNFAEGLVRSEPGGFVLTPEFGRHVDEFTNFKIRKDDVWVVTFPKCGKIICLWLSDSGFKIFFKRNNLDPRNGLDVDSRLRCRTR